MIIPIGNFCHIAEGLKYLSLRKNAYPFDWIFSPIESISKILLEILNMECKDRIDEWCDNFFKTDGNSTITGYGGSVYFANTEYDISFPHDDIETICNKYKRRYKRLWEHFHCLDNKITFLYASRWEHHDDELYNLISQVSALRSDVKFVIVNGIEHDRRIPNVTLLKLQYPLDKRLMCENNNWDYDQTDYKNMLFGFIHDHSNLLQ